MTRSATTWSLVLRAVRQPAHDFTTMCEQESCEGTPEQLSPDFVAAIFSVQTLLYALRDVLDVTPQRRDVIAAAIAACQQRCGTRNTLEALAQDLADHDSIQALKNTLKTAGPSIGG
jgi:hypothetical protein